jgi:hypothetical protein
MIAEATHESGLPSKAQFTHAGVQRLNAGARDLLKTHFVALEPEDRRLRFGGSLSADSIAAYVVGIDFDRDAVFCPRRRRGDRLAASGASGAPCARGDANRRAHLGHACSHSAAGAPAERCLPAPPPKAPHNRSVGEPFHAFCLAENAAIHNGRGLARKSGMRASSPTAGVVDAHLALAPAGASSIAGEYLVDRFAVYDATRSKAHVAAWMGHQHPFEGPDFARIGVRALRG